MILPIVTIAPSQHRGRGVFATENIPAGTMIEISPVLVLSAAERTEVEKTLLYDYIFEWGEDNTQCCVALGYVSMYNHSYKANCDYQMDFEEERISITTVRDIEAGEELFINYNAEPESENLVWFETK
ncbi:MAG: SET domain-containing protein [Bacteroidota bacterium]